MAGRGSGDVFFRPLAHHLTFGHLDSPVDDNVEVDAKFDVSVDSFTITKTVAAHVATTDIIFTGSLVCFVRHKPVTSAEDRFVSKDATHGFSVISSHFVYRTWPFRVVYRIRTIFSLLPGVTEGVR